jgi:peptidoglycan/LPS O-acetylase OafA/YrhL
MKYRPEIDGLRAVAVVPVLIFHGGLGFRGGFVGVDVFFVISGYLITSIMYREVEERKFSLARFYERRLRRIAPALVCVCLACLPFAWAWMLPYELRDFGRSLYQVNLFVSNFYFWTKTGYFDASNDLKPLLHTWSLGVEEQFYILFPVVLMALRRFRRQFVLAAILLLSATSFLATQLVPLFDPAANFYLLPTRFWELGVGASISMANVGGEKARYGGLAAACGLAMIVLSCFFVEGGPSYPGWQTLPVVAGTALVLLFSSSENLAGRLLSARALVFVGLISYSLYLWHQPVLAFARLRLFTNDLSASTSALLLCLTVLLAVASYYLVERPFRDRNRVGTKSFFTLAGVAAAASIASGFMFEMTDGAAFRSPGLYEMTEVSKGLSENCNGEMAPECSTSDNPEIAVWGDSFGAHLVEGILASAPDVKLVQFTKSLCGPFTDITYPVTSDGRRSPEGCLSWNRDVLDAMAETKTLRYVAIGVNLDIYAETETFVRKDGQSVPAGRALLLDSFLASLSGLRQMGLSPVVFAQPPQTGTDVGGCVARSRLLGIAADHCDLSADDVNRRGRVAMEITNVVARDYPVIDLGTGRCNGTICRVSEDGVSLYADAGHYSQGGIRLLGKKYHLYDLIVKAATEGCGDGSAPAARPAGFCRP